jgi:hypothetical protein
MMDIMLINNGFAIYGSYFFREFRIIDFSIFGFIVMDMRKAKTPSETGFLGFLGLSCFN